MKEEGKEVFHEGKRNKKGLVDNRGWGK